jgi:DNA-binding MarR family transcriptional regulator
MEKNNEIVIKTDKELKIFMSPIRQKIIRFMRIEGKSITAKYIADKLNMSPPSAQHHIKQLESLNIIEFDHSEVINGITAKYLKLTDKNISFGQNIDDDLSLERDVLAKNILNEIYNGYEKTITNMRPVLIEEFNKDNKFADFLSGVVHLTEEESKELYFMINDFLEKHSKASTDTHPFEYALVTYRTDLNNNGKG